MFKNELLTLLTIIVNNYFVINVIFVNKKMLKMLITSCIIGSTYKIDVENY